MRRTTPEQPSIGERDEWYVQMDGRTKGPATFTQLRALADAGRIDRDTLLRYGKDGAWAPAGEVRGRLARRKQEEKGERRRPWSTRFGQWLRTPAGAWVVALCALVGVVVFVATSPRGHEAESRRVEGPEQVARRVLPSVGIVRGERGSGSGFVVAPGLLVTNHHVIANELLRKVTVEFPNDRGELTAYPVRARYMNAQRDLAFLAFDADLAPLPLAQDHVFQAGQSVLVVGSPGLGGGRVLANAVAQGLLSTKVELDGLAFYQLDVPVNPGNSGGPVVDMAGEVIGVVTARAVAGERLAFAVPLSSLQSALIKAKTATEDGIRKLKARHRLHVAYNALLPAAKLYYLAMVAYVRTLDPTQFRNEVPDDGPQDGTLGSLLEKIDRALIAELRLEEDEIRKDTALTVHDRNHFDRLWRVYAELKNAVDMPEGSILEYAGLCRRLGLELKGVSQLISVAGY